MANAQDQRRPKGVRCIDWFGSLYYCYNRFADSLGRRGILHGNSICYIGSTFGVVHGIYGRLGALNTLKMGY